MRTRLLFLFIFLIELGIAQVLVNPCLNLPGCQSSTRNGVVHSEFTLLTANQKYNLLVAAGDTITRKIDTTFSGTVNLTLISGPGTFVGASNKSFSKYAYMDLKFFTGGAYALEIEVVGVGKDTMFFDVYVDDFAKMCSDYNLGCVSGGGNKIKMQGPNVIVVDVMFPFNVLVVDPSGRIDITYAGVVTLSKLSGVGNLIGNLSLYGEQRITFNDLSFDQVGSYDVVVDVEHIGKDTMTFVVEAANGIKNHEVQKCKVYPNPTTGITFIQLEKESQFISLIKVFNVVGECVKTIDICRNVSGTEILSLDLNDLSRGTYCINVNGSQKNIYSPVVLLK